MNYEEMLYRLTSDCDWCTFSDCEKCKLAFEKMKYLAEKEDKYGWHDLRKDPNDLPEFSEDTRCVEGNFLLMFDDGTFGLAKKYETVYWKRIRQFVKEFVASPAVAYPLNAVLYKYEKKVIKWKYIDNGEDEVKADG